MPQTEQFTLADGRVLTIRPLTVSDYTAVQEYLEQLATETIFTNQYVGRPRATPEKYAAALAHDWRLSAWDGHRLAGFVSAGFRADHKWYRHTCSFGIHALAAYHRQGLGTYLMMRLEQWARENHVHRIEGEVRIPNWGGLNLYLKRGFQIEGCRRQIALIDGQWYDNYMIAKILEM